MKTTLCGQNQRPCTAVRTRTQTYKERVGENITGYRKQATVGCLQVEETTSHREAGSAKKREKGTEVEWRCLTSK